MSIGTALPKYHHRQMDILKFMLDAYQPEADDRRKITLMYERCGIHSRYSVIPDYSCVSAERTFYSASPDLEPFPRLEKRLSLYDANATSLSVQAIHDCLPAGFDINEITCLITVSCTGMSAPGLDISLMQALQLPSNIQRSSINFMGCYAAIHALKMADRICRSDSSEKVLIVCTELCTIHFQKECDMDSIASALLFGDGAAAVLVSGDGYTDAGVRISNFYSQVALHGQDDMAWQLSGKGFLMRLSAYIPQLLQAGIASLLNSALAAGGHEKDQITKWAIHPGGKKILESIGKELQITQADLKYSYDVLRDYGNMSSPTILFVLKEILADVPEKNEKIFTAAFGPGLTMETVILQR